MRRQLFLLTFVAALALIGVGCKHKASANGGPTQVVIKTVDGQVQEPYERITIDIPPDYIGAVQEALRNQQFAAPELEAQAAQQATAEEMQRTQAAGQVAGQLGNTALGAQQNQTQRISAGAQAAAGAVQGQLGTRQQDIDIAKSNQTAASTLMQDVARLTGTQLELDQRNQELIGQMARDAAAMKFNWGQLDAQTQEAEFDRWVKVYGIDQAAAAQIKAAAKANDKNAWDYIVPIVGAAATVGAAAL